MTEECPICGEPNIKSKEDNLPEDADYSIIFCGNHTDKEEWDYIESHRQVNQ